MDFLKEHMAVITLIIAVVALLQHWVIAFFKWVLFPGSIDVFETGNLEIGYCELGPTVGLTGTLRATGCDMFVRRMKVVVINEQGFHHEFEWDVFRDRRITVGREKQAEYEEPAGFMVTTLSPKRFNIQFHDVDVLGDMRNHFFQVHQEWAGMITELDPEEMAQRHEKVKSLPEEFQDPYRDMFDKYAASKQYGAIKANLEELNYWKPGTYTVRLVVQTAKPAKQYEKENSFTLSAEDIKAMEMNVDKMLEDICNRKSGRNYYFAYPRHQNLSIV